MQNPSPQAMSKDRRKWWVLVAVGIGTFMSGLDGSVVNAVLPIIRQTFGVPVTSIEWVIVVYLLVVSGLLLTFGRLGDLRGHRGMFLSGFVVFLVGSAVCGFAPSVTGLIIARGFQALGAAMLFSNSPAILTASFPPEQRGQALGLQGTMTYLGLTVGPALGGWLTQAFSWRAVFYINLPIGLLALLLSWKFIPQDRPSGKEERFDLTGALLFMAGLVLLLLALNRGSAWGWGSAAVVGLMVMAFLLLFVFVRWETRTVGPMLDLSLFRLPVFSAASASAILNYISLYTIIFLMPFYLITARGLNPSQAGLMLIAQPLVMAVVAPLSGTLSDRIGSRLPATLGMLILAVGLFWLSFSSMETPLAFIAIGLGICGFGTGIFISPNNSALMGAAPRNRQGIASGILATARNVGMTLGIGLSGAILTTFQSFGGQGNAPLLGAIHMGFLVAAGVALLAALASAVRGAGN